MFPRFSRSTRSSLSLAGVALTLGLVTACAGQASDSGSSDSGSDKSAASQVSKKSEATIVSNIRPHATGVGIERKLRLTVNSGTFDTVQVSGPKGGIVQGALSADKTHWVSRTPFQAASTYQVTG